MTRPRRRATTTEATKVSQQVISGFLLWKGKVSASDDDEEDRHQDGRLETQLFAGLRRKIESNMKKVQDMMQVGIGGRRKGGGDLGSNR